MAVGPDEGTKGKPPEGVATASSSALVGLGLGATLALALGYWRPHLRMGAVLLAVLAVPQGFKAFFAYSQRLIIDGGLLAHDADLLIRVLALLAAGLVLAALAVLAGDYLSARIGGAILNGIRARMFRHLQRLSVGFYAEARSGDLVARFTSDLSDLQKSLTTRLVDAVVAALGLAINVPVAFYIDWRLATLMLLALPFAGLGTRIFGRRAAAARYALKQEESGVASAVQESVRAQPVVKVFGLVDWLIGRFERQLEQLRRRYVRAEFLAEVVGSASSLGVLAAQVAVLGFGTYLAFRGGLSTGSLVAFLAVHAVVSKDAYDLTKKVIPSLISSSGGLQRIEELLALEGAVQDEPGARPLGRLQGPLALERVSFAYTAGAPPVLREVSLEILPGERVALVGPSGSGKSTVLQLLLRYYDPQSGRVLVDGEDARRFTLASLHERTAAVFQDSFLFAGTIRENLALGRLGASEREIHEAARAAEIHEAILALPAGYDTEVGEVGGRLSGGQRQRLAIARAVLRDPDLLLLDEATSALDPATEAAVNATLERLGRGRMVVLVTHRLAAASSADRIVVLDRGRIAESGTHSELFALGGLYRELWGKQTGLEVSDDGLAARVEPERLAAIPLLAALDEPARRALAGRFACERREAGEVVLRQGEAGDRFYVVARGKLEVVSSVGTGEGGVEAKGRSERRLGVLGDGDFFGEMALLGEKTRRATVRALQPSTLLTLAGEDFQALLAREPRLAAEVARVAAERARQAGSLASG